MFYNYREKKKQSIIVGHNDAMAITNRFPWFRRVRYNRVGLNIERELFLKYKLDEATKEIGGRSAYKKCFI